MSENIWNASSRIIKIAGNYELAIFDEQGDRIAIATGPTEEACRINATAIIEGHKLREEKLQSSTQPTKSLSAENKCDNTEQ